MADVLPYLGYSPEYSEDDLESMGNAVPNVTGNAVLKAKSELNKKGIEYEVIGDGETVVDQMPKGGTNISTDSKVILYTEQDSEKKTVTVPNVIGKNLTEAVETLINSGLTVHLSGSNVTGETGNIIVTGQDVKDGEEVERGTTVSITYSRNDEVN